MRLDPNDRGTLEIYIVCDFHLLQSKHLNTPQCFSTSLKSSNALWSRIFCGLKSCKGRPRRWARFHIIILISRLHDRSHLREPSARFARSHYRWWWWERENRTPGSRRWTVRDTLPKSLINARHSVRVHTLNYVNICFLLRKSISKLYGK